MKNVKLNLAKKYVASFYDLLRSLKDEKSLKEIRKNVEKYEDVSYIKGIVDEEVLERIASHYQHHKNVYATNYEKLSADISSFYDTYFANKEIIDVSAINKALNELQKELDNSTHEEYLCDPNALFEFKNNITVELRTYVDKHKSDEYMDMAIFHQSITGIIKEVKETLAQLIADNRMDPKKYQEKYLEMVYAEYAIIFEGSANKTKTIPQWLKGLIFCTPWIIGFLLFTLYPLIQTFIFSFSKVDLSPNGFITSPNGFNNYINVFTRDTDFILALKNYLINMLVYVPLITIFSLILAMLLNSKIKSKGFFRTIFFFPVIITSGPVIKILMEQGVTAMTGVATLIDVQAVTAKMPELVRIAFLTLTDEFIMILWFSGIQILVFVTGLQKIDKGVYEASAIDGANKWEQFWKVTLPAINPTIIINVVFTVVMQSIFALNPIILKIQKDMNDTSEGKGYGYSSALAFTYFLIMIIVLVIFVLIFKRKNHKSKEGR